MPYAIHKKGSGYKVCKKVGGKCFSKKPLPLARAKRQMSAIQMNESNFDSICSKILTRA